MSRRVLLRACGVLVALAAGTSASAQISWGPALVRPEDGGLLPAAKLTYEPEGFGKLETRKCFPFFREASTAAELQLVTKADKNAEALTARANAGALLRLTCNRGDYRPGGDDVEPAQLFDWGALYAAADAKVASNQRRTEASLTPEASLFYIQPDNNWPLFLIPDLEGTLAAHRPLRSAKRDSAGIAHTWERRWDGVARWRGSLTGSASKAFPFRPVEINYVLHGYLTNIDEQKAPGPLRKGTMQQASLSLLAPSWTRARSLDLNWVRGSLPEQPESTRAWSLGMTFE